VQQLLEIARRQGIRRVYMKTNADNAASQSGIVKAGLAKIGKITVVKPPLMPGRTIVLRRLRP
jgi:predicted acetyltransferase